MKRFGLIVVGSLFAGGCASYEKMASPPAAEVEDGAGSTDANFEDSLPEDARGEDPWGDDGDDSVEPEPVEVDPMEDPVAEDDPFEEDETASDPFTERPAGGQDESGEVVVVFSEPGLSTSTLARDRWPAYGTAIQLSVVSVREGKVSTEPSVLLALDEALADEVGLDAVVGLPTPEEDLGLPVDLEDLGGWVEEGLLLVDLRPGRRGGVKGEAFLVDCASGELLACYELSGEVGVDPTGGELHLVERVGVAYSGLKGE